MTEETAKLSYMGKTYELPVITGTEGEKAIDISRLRQDTGLITLDPGYANTGSCTSDITFMDGEKGILRYRGIPVEQLAEILHLPGNRLSSDQRRTSAHTGIEPLFRYCSTTRPWSTRT